MNAIKSARNVANLTQDELAKRAGVSRITVVRAERKRNINTDTLKKLAAALNCTLDELANDKSESA